MTLEQITHWNETNMATVTDFLNWSDTYPLAHEFQMSMIGLLADMDNPQALARATAAIECIEQFGQVS